LAAKEAAALIRLLEELRADNIAPVTIYKDSQLAIDLLKRTAANSRTKHIDIRWHYIRQEVDLGHITVKKISTHEQIADGLTKALDKAKFKQFKQQLGVVDCTNMIKRN
jgi:ribonuclease HI